jgi:hypothetical protein
MSGLQEAWFVSIEAGRKYKSRDVMAFNGNRNYQFEHDRILRRSHASKNNHRLRSSPFTRPGWCTLTAFYRGAGGLFRPLQLGIAQGRVDVSHAG